MSLMCLFTYGVSWLSHFYLLPCWFDFCCYLEGGHGVYLLKKLNICHATVVLEKAPESPLDCQEIKPANPKGNQPWIIIGRTDAEAESLILWPTDEKSQLFRKGPDAGKDWRQEVKGMTEDEMVGWHHWFNGHEFEQTLGVGEGQGSLACYSLQGHKDSDITEQLNNNNLITKFKLCKTHREDIRKQPVGQGISWRKGKSCLGQD